MKDERRFEQEYRKLKTQAAPDLWDRIEGRLQEHPERNMEQLGPNIWKDSVSEDHEQKKNENENTTKILGFPKRRVIYGAATVAAAMLVVLVISPAMLSALGIAPRFRPFMLGGYTGFSSSAEPSSTAAAMQEISDLTGMEAMNGAAEGTAFETAEMEEAVAMDEAAPETALLQEAGGWSDGDDKPAAAAGGTPAGVAVIGGVPANDEMLPGDGDAGNTTVTTGGISGNSSFETSVNSDRKKVYYDQLALPDDQPIEIPANTSVILESPIDFSEYLLADTELLCRAVVTDAYLDINEKGETDRVAYEIAVEEVYFMSDSSISSGNGEVAEIPSTMTIFSPIMLTGQAPEHILHQLQPGGIYLLTLRMQEENEEKNWEIVFPYAPQIQLTGDGGYLFHSGYVSMVDDQTVKVIAGQDGPNDDYYDRMLFRKDDGFLSEFVDLLRMVMDQVRQ